MNAPVFCTGNVELTAASAVEATDSPAPSIIHAIVISRMMDLGIENSCDIVAYLINQATPAGGARHPLRQGTLDP